MKKTIFLLTLVCSLWLSAGAQSQFISFSPMGVEDRHNPQLNGNGGVLVLSEISDLVVTVVQAPATPVERSQGKNAAGYYEYTLEVNSEVIPNAKIEVAKRGDVNRTSFTVGIRPNYLRAYLVEEVSQPIVLENQTAGNDAKLDATRAEVEISSTLGALRIEYDSALGATLTKTRKANDASVSVYTLSIPVANIAGAKDNLQELRRQHAELEKKLLGTQGGSDAEWQRLDDLEAQCAGEEQRLAKLCQAR